LFRAVLGMWKKGGLANLVVRVIGLCAVLCDGEWSLGIMS